MAATTLLTLRERLQRRLADTEAQHWAPATLNNFINEAQREVVLECPALSSALWKVETVAGQRDYALPETFQPPLRFVFYQYDGTNERPLPYEPLSRSATYHAAGTGTPVAFTYVHSGPRLDLRIFPAPPTSGIYIRVNAGRVPTDITADTDSFALPRYAENCVLSRARYLAWEEWEEDPRCDRALQEYERQLVTVKRRANAPIAVYPVQVGEPLTEMRESERPPGL